MIIKSLSRNTKSFEALYKYLTRDNDSLLNTFNLYANPCHKQDLIREFLENAEHLKRARGKNYLYHEIISLSKNNLSLKEQQDILIDLVAKYVSLRASEHLTFTALHKDRENIHIHLMISANELMGQKRVRLSKHEFSTIQKELEQYINTTYPEVGKTSHYQNGKSLENSKNREQESKRRTKTATKKELLKLKIENLFEKSSTKTYFKDHIEKIGLEFYTRGKTVGIIFEGKKYRLKTLGVLESYNELLERLEQVQETENTNEDKKVDSNINDTKINSRREQMKKVREDQEQEPRVKR